MSDLINTSDIPVMTIDQLNDFERLEHIVVTQCDIILAAAKAVGDSLIEIKEKGYYRMLRPDGTGKVYKTFAEYVQDKYKRGKTMAYNYLKVANVMSFLQDAGIDSAQVGTINTAIALNNEVRRTIRVNTGSYSNLDEFSKQILVDGWKAVIQTAPIDNLGQPIVTADHVHNVFDVVRDVVASESVEVDGTHIPINQAKLAVNESILTHQAENIKKLNEYIVEQYEKKKNKMAQRIPSESRMVNSKEIFVVTCPIHGEVSPLGLVRGGFICSCDCTAILVENIRSNETKFVRLNES